MSASTYHTKVAGVTHSGRQGRVWTLRPGKEVFLVREPDNPYDKNAIRVERPAGGAEIGYIPRELARQIATQLDSIGGIVEATVVELTGGTRSYPNRGVIISFSIPSRDIGTPLVPFGRIHLREDPGKSVAISGKDELLTVIYYHEKGMQCETWQCRPLKLLREVKLKALYTQSDGMAASYSGDKVATLGYGEDRSSRRVQIWDTWSGNLIATMDAPRVDSTGCKIRFSQADDLLMLGGAATDTHEGLITAWRTDTWEKVIDHKKRIGREDIVNSYPWQNIFGPNPIILDPDNGMVLWEVIASSSGSTLQ